MIEFFQKPKLYMRDEGLYLEDILDSIDAILRFLDNVEKENFLASELLQSAVSQKFMVIGEAASKVSKELRGRYPEIDWKGLISFRNVLIHFYFGLDLEIVWDTTQNRLSKLKTEIAKILLEDFPLP